MTDTQPPADVKGTGNPLADLLTRAIKAHPVLRDQKKLHVKVVGESVRVEGSVFTRDHYRQLLDLVAKVPGGESIPVLVESEVKPPQARDIVGRVPDVSQGPPNVDRRFSVRHLSKPAPEPRDQ